MADNFFFAEGDKKNYSAKKKNYSPTNEVTHPTETPICLWYDVFMTPTTTKKYRNTRIFNRRPRLIFFLPKKTSWILYFQLVNFHFIFVYAQVIAFFFLPLWTFHSFFFWESHHFFLKSFGTWYKFLIVIFFFQKTKKQQMHIQQHFTKKNINI